jgi:hypothetical protein
MTPLFARVLEQLTLPKRERTLSDPDGMLRFVSDVHCFEATKAERRISELCQASFDGPTDHDLAFLPAERTWIELEYRGERLGYLLMRGSADDHATLFVCDEMYFAARRLGRICLWFDPADALASPQLCEIQRFLACVLIVINTPRHVGRRTHTPDKRLEIALLARQSVIGKFPLHAWTEITLEVGSPIDHSDEPPVEAHFTGRKCLHFCREHVRVLSTGEQIHVKEHWRGDAALGIKRSRYRLAEPPPPPHRPGGAPLGSHDNPGGEFDV